MSSRRALPHLQRQPLHDVASTRRIEHEALGSLAPYAVMARAGQAIARLTLALAPHARHIWVACGPGNNGGDGMAAALQLHRMGKRISVTRCAGSAHSPADAAQALLELQQAGLTISDTPPDQVDFCIDALLGIGAHQEPRGEVSERIAQINATLRPVLAVDTPSGLNAETGVASRLCIKADWTITLLTLKPGLFTAQGRDFGGDVWLDDLELGRVVQSTPGQAWLGAAMPASPRAHASHKGSYGDVAVIGGASGMAGAALLAASAALHGGAGRVFVGLLDSSLPLLHPELPELMLRRADQIDLGSKTVVCGCGGSQAIQDHLPGILTSASPVVLDADALNALAKVPKLQAELRRRAQQSAPTVITPHPLEAARLLGISVSAVQSDRLSAARTLCQLLGCTVILKGSGTVVMAPGELPVIIPTGNAKLATAGSGDVLAGMVGARLAQGSSAFEAACAASYQHGLIADQWPSTRPLTASDLARSVQY